MSFRKINGILIDADTLDSLNAALAANQIPVLNADAKMALANLVDAVCSETEADNKIAAAVVYAELTVPIFKSIGSVGTFTNPERVNDDDTATVANADTINEYVEILFPAVMTLTQYRIYAWNTDHAGDGHFKLQYLTKAGVWTDWITGIPTSSSAAWSNWASDSEVEALGIRLVCTAVDTRGAEADRSDCGELEVKH